MTAPWSPRRLSVQVWADPTGGGFVGYVPQTDTEATGLTFDQAQSRALATARAHQNTSIPGESSVLHDQAEPQWRCICGRDNPPGRTGCSRCASPQL